jgi:hypothetical protein
MSGSQISRYVNDEDWPRGETLEKIVAELNVKVQQITRSEQGLGGHPSQPGRGGSVRQA